VQPHPRYRRDGLNLYIEQKVSVWNLILGGEVEVEAIDGSRLVVKVPARTQPGTTLRLRQQGLRDRNGQHGDLMVHIQVDIPKDIAPEIITAIQNHA
jgi:molecular chaperone DnaJ